MTEPEDPAVEVTRARVLAAIEPILSALPEDAVELAESDSADRRTVTLRPRVHGAVDVLIDYRDLVVYAFVGSDTPIEIAAPYNDNYGPPVRPWADELRSVVEAAAEGHVVLGRRAGGPVVSVRIDGSRLGVDLNIDPGSLELHRAVPWANGRTDPQA